MSAVTDRAEGFVGERLPAARALGTELQDLIQDPDAFLRTLRRGLHDLADPAYIAEQARVAPGGDPALGVRWPLIRAIEAALQPALAATAPAFALYLADRLAAQPERDIRAFAHPAIIRVLADDPERGWEQIRRMAERARDWISVDSLAGVVAEGILLETRRWAELELLVYSPSPWERRLVAATIATIPRLLRRDRRDALRPAPALALIASLVGDPEPHVQKALSWALRSWTEVDPDGTASLLRTEAVTAAETQDGHRAWVLRDALAAQSPTTAAEVRDLLAGIRRRATDPSTSVAGEARHAFAEVYGR